MSKISIIAAVSKNGVIGKDNKLPWHLPEDMKFFKDTTTGHCVITGRKNYESIPAKFRPLKDRTNIVVTRQEGYAAEGAVVVQSIEAAIEAAKKTGDEEIFIIGGADVYKQCMGLADRMYITSIEQEFEGDVFFPEIGPEWTIAVEITPSVEPSIKYKITIYEKNG
jgi:dihydrofolate reductase